MVHKKFHHLAQDANTSCRLARAASKGVPWYLFVGAIDILLRQSKPQRHEKVLQQGWVPTLRQYIGPVGGRETGQVARHEKPGPAPVLCLSFLSQDTSSFHS